MIEIQPGAKSQLLCVRCGHSEDDHNWQSGPCNHKDYELRTHCICYAFVSPLSACWPQNQNDVKGGNFNG